MLFKIELTFETRDDAENLLELLEAWELTDLDSVSRNNYPREAFGVKSIQEINDSNEMDKISIIWGIDDVHNVADQELSDDEAREVLDRAERYHDASIGINWDVLDVYVDMVIREREEK